jgi:hypothetical protein
MSTHTVRAIGVCVAALSIAGCTGGHDSPGPSLDALPGMDGASDAAPGMDGASDASTGPSTDASPELDGGSLIGTWMLTTNASNGVTTVTIGQDSLNVTSPEFSLTATRAGNALTFTDYDNPSNPSNAGVLTATQTPGAFNAGIVPFDLGGSWTMQAGTKGMSPFVTCTLDVSAGEIDGACRLVSPDGPWFHFTSQKMPGAAASIFGDFGGDWINTWTWDENDGGTFPCALHFAGSGITTCTGGAMNGRVVGSPLAGITFTYDGAHTLSGAAQGWAEFSATR